LARPEVLSTVKEDFGGEDASSSSHLISSSATTQANRKGVNLFIIRFTFGLIDLGENSVSKLHSEFCFGNHTIPNVNIPPLM
jgi:hypothetical protein